MNFVSKYYTRSTTCKFAIIPLEIIHLPTKVANVILFCNFHGLNLTSVNDYIPAR